MDFFGVRAEAHKPGFLQLPRLTWSEQGLGIREGPAAQAGAAPGARGSLQAELGRARAVRGGPRGWLGLIARAFCSLSLTSACWAPSHLIGREGRAASRRAGTAGERTQGGVLRPVATEKAGDALQGRPQASEDSLEG